MRFAPPVQVLEIVSFHVRLCERLRPLQADVPEPKSVRVKGAPPMRRGLYRRRDKFFDVFMIIDDAPWEEQDVLFVCKDEETARAYGVTEAAENGSNQDKLDIGVLSPTCVFRLPLKQAMQAVFSTNDDRRKKRREYNAYFEETLGSEDEAQH